MKLSNCVVGQVIEAKRDVVGINDSIIPKGIHVLVGKIQIPSIDAYPVRVDHDSFGSGYEWVNPADFRKVTEVQEVTEVDAVPDNVQKGTKVICVRGFVEPRFSDTFKAGVVYVVHKDGLDHDGELNLAHPSLGGGHGYGKPQHFRLYKEPQQPVLTEECTTQNLEVGDTVLVGAEGAGRYAVRREYAGLTCTVTEINSDGTVEIAHPHVLGGNSYTSNLKHLTKAVKEPVVEPKPVVQEKLPPTYIQVGDYILSSGRDPELEADTLYEVVKVDPRHIGISLHTSSRKVWQEYYCLVMSDYSKVLREVQPDADTPTA